MAELPAGLNASPAPSAPRIVTTSLMPVRRVVTSMPATCRRLACDAIEADPAAASPAAARGLGAAVPRAVMVAGDS